MAFKRLKRAGRAAPVATPSSSLPIPASAPDGAVMMSAGKYARSIVLAAFEQMGGLDTFVEWASANKTDYYTKLFGKTVTREVEERRESSVEDLLDAIDAEATPVATDVEFEDV